MLEKISLIENLAIDFSNGEKYIYEYIINIIDNVVLTELGQTKRKEFYKMLTENADENKILKFIEDNIDNFQYKIKSRLQSELISLFQNKI
jgi:hypothetical protein